MKFVEPKLPVDSEELLAIQRLLLQAQLGDEMGFIGLFARYQPLIRKVWQSYYGAEMEFSDWKQEAFIILFRVLQAYPNLESYQFGSFYKQSLNNRMVDLCRSRQANKRIPQQSLADLNNYLEEVATKATSGAVEEITHCHFCLQELVRSCSAFECRVLMLLNSGHTAEQVSLELSCSRRQVESAINRLRLKTIQILK